MRKIYQSSQFNDKNAIRKWKIYIFQISVVCMGVCAYMDATPLLILRLYHNTKNVTFYIASEVFKGRWDILGHYFRQCLEVFGSCWDVFRNPNHDRTKISCIWLRKSWQLWIRTSNGIVMLYLPVHKIIFSLVRYFIVCAVFVRHSSERKGGSAKTTSNEHSVIESGKSRGLL